MEKIGGKRKQRGIVSFFIVLVFVLTIAWQDFASADQTLAEKLIEIMRANNQITEEQYKELKKQAEAEKASQAAGIAQQVKTETAKQVKTETAKIAAEKKPLIEYQPGEGEGGMNFNMKGIKVNIGGFIEAAGIYRSRDENADVGSTFNNLPLANKQAFFQDETRFSARQSRLSVLVQGDYDPTVHLAGYYEMDFLGAAHTANSNESNSYNLRIRHLYATGDWDTCGLHLLAGQNWSLVTQNTMGITPREEEIPLTIDAQYVPGFNWARQPQFRITKDWDKTYWLAVSVENPQTTYAAIPSPQGPLTNYALNQTPGGLFDSTGSISVNDVPDIVVKAAYESSFGHFEVFNLTRTFESSLKTKSGQLANEDIVRDAVGGGFDIPIIPKRLNIMASAMYGPGIGRYGSGQLADVTEDALGAVHPITALHLLGGLTWQPMNRLQIYGYYGRETADRADLAKGKIGYGYGSEYYDDTIGVIGSSLFQGEIQTIDQFTIGDWYSIYQGKYGALKFGLQYSYTRNIYFSGTSAINSKTGAATGMPIGGPTASDNMVFTSLRYYWK